jgi:hypothetical protein
MTIHLRRLAVGIESIEHLAEVQRRRRESFHAKGIDKLYTYTGFTPKRADELVDGGSLYWVIKGVMRVRQRVLGVEPDTREDGKRFCKLWIDPQLVRVEPRPQKAFQGWRYLEPEAAPRDLVVGAEGADELPDEMAAELRDLGLL